MPQIFVGFVLDPAFDSPDVAQAVIDKCMKAMAEAHGVVVDNVAEAGAPPPPDPAAAGEPATRRRRSSKAPDEITIFRLDNQPIGTFTDSASAMDCFTVAWEATTTLADLEQLQKVNLASLARCKKADFDAFAPRVAAHKQKVAAAEKAPEAGPGDPFAGYPGLAAGSGSPAPAVTGNASAATGSAAPPPPPPPPTATAGESSMAQLESLFAGNKPAVAPPVAMDPEAFGKEMLVIVRALGQQETVALLQSMGFPTTNAIPVEKYAEVVEVAKKHLAEKQAKTA